MNGKFALVVTLAAGTALAPMAADAALLSLTNGTSKTPSGNDVLAAGTTLFDKAQLSTTQNNVELTFYFSGSESGFDNTLNVGSKKHTEADEYPASWPGLLAVDSVTQASAGSVDISFTSSGRDDTAKSIAFAYLADTSGKISSTSTDIVLFAFDDGGSGADKDFDDYVGYVEATLLTPTPISEAAPVTPAPIPAALPLFVTAMAGLGLMGRRRMKAAV